MYNYCLYSIISILIQFTATPTIPLFYAISRWEHYNIERWQKVLDIADMPNLKPSSDDITLNNERKYHPNTPPRI
jgi:hypothetical protein